MSYESLFVNPKGRTARGPFLAALAVLLAVVAYYYLRVRGGAGLWAMVVLVFPWTVLHARRLHDMGMTAWPVLAPAAVLMAVAVIRLKLVAVDAGLANAAPMIAVAVIAACAAVGALGKGQAEANRFGEPVAA